MEPASGPSVSRPTRSARPFSPRCGRLWRPRASARLTRTRSRKRESRGCCPGGSTPPCPPSSPASCAPSRCGCWRRRGRCREGLKPTTPRGCPNQSSGPRSRWADFQQRLQDLVHAPMVLGVGAAMMDQCPLHRVRAQRAEASRLREFARCALEEVEVLQLA